MKFSYLRIIDNSSLILWNSITFCSCQVIVEIKLKGDIEKLVEVVLNERTDDDDIHTYVNFMKSFWKNRLYRCWLDRVPCSTSFPTVASCREKKIPHIFCRVYVNVYHAFRLLPLFEKVFTLFGCNFIISNLFIVWVH